MSAYEQIRNRLSSNGKVTQEANVFSKSFIKEGLIVNFDRQNIFQDKNGFTLWKKVVAGMSAGGKVPVLQLLLIWLDQVSIESTS